MARSKKIVIGIQDRTAPRKQAILLTVLSVLLFFTTLFSVVETAKTTALILLILALVGGILCFRTLKARITLPLAMLLLFVVMNGISTAYALSGKFALREFLKLVIALGIGLILLMLTPGEGVKPARRIATVLEGSAALAALFSVDLISTRLLSTPLITVMMKYSSAYFNLTGVEAGIRLTSIFENPNIFAGCTGIGVLLALSLAQSSEGIKERRFHLCCLYVTSTAFVLAFSMGATASIAVAFLVYLLLERRRGELLLLMGKTLILAFVSVILCAMTSLDAWNGFQPIPLLCLIVGAVLLCLADSFVCRNWGEKLQKHGKISVIAIVLLVVLIAGFALTAYNLTGDVSLSDGEILRRSVYPAPGDYSVTAEGDNGIWITVESQNREDTMMHTSTVIYNGPLSNAAFTVPEDSLVVYFNLKAETAANLQSVTLNGNGESFSLPLGYKLLPGFIANRLQGLKANQNAIQRLVFFDDGISLFHRSPIFGLGLGAFENAICSVQSFYYETKYVHNHYIQVLLEVGVIGLILFVSLLVGSAAAVLRSLKKGDHHPLTPALGAALVFMAIHAATEVVFSSQFYLPLAFGIFILISLCCGDALRIPVLNQTVKTWIPIVSGALAAVFGILLCGNLMAASIVDRNGTFDSVERAIKMDRYEWTDYALSYVMSSATGSNTSAIREKAAQYAEDLTEVNSNIIPFRLSEYYLMYGNVPKALEMAEKYANYCSSNSTAWNNLLQMISGYYYASAEFRAGVVHLVDMMEQWDAENIGSIELDPATLDFLDFVYSH